MPQPPVVQGGAFSGHAYIPFGFVVSTSDTDPITWSLTNAPSGMSVGSGGAVSWPAPIQGTYNVTATARDTLTGLTGQGKYTVTIGAAFPPSVLSQTITGSSMGALSFTVIAGDTNPLTFALSGMPKGMTIGSTSGVVSWPAPIVGSYNVVVTATDTKTGLSAQGTYTVKILAEPGPKIVAAPLKGVAGKSLTATITFTDSASAVVGTAVWNYPPGMSVSGSLSALTLSRPSPLTGSYILYIQATDVYGLSAQLQLPVTISAK